ncbi:hypothetical protein [Breznakiella homolactica]|uniref:Beta-1,6-galactofuranosyltransferase n=1 Tax=Breznakiella homolactica TaxID=2798577 RepID=A0A7T7XNW8_9SPIR|nr:hypothetical protein [Breznakiella homolactica]QQO09805.1 hypothetical protein JFL75_02530 [Breznakiella homolactica]
MIQKKYSSRYIMVEPHAEKNHAGPKARNDVLDILLSCGYIPVSLKVRIPEFVRKPHGPLLTFFSKILANIKSYFAFRRFFSCLTMGSSLFIQYPFERVQLKIAWQIKIFEYLMQNKKIEITFIIHDIDGVRYKDPIKEKNDLSFLKLGSHLIVHNQGMVQYYVGNGFELKKLTPVFLFDYLFDNKAGEHKKSDGIAFAGNLAKAGFINKIPELGNDIKFNLYGDFNKKIPNRENVFYNGSFRPDELPAVIIGGFGLVWDGESLETCSGAIGEYLKLNSPHKVSLYIVSGIPVILWAKSALAGFILEKKLGFVIDSLFELQEKINTITEQQYTETVINVKIFSEKLKKGEQLIHANSRYSALYG